MPAVRSPEYEETLSAIIQNTFSQWPPREQNAGLLRVDPWGNTPLHSSARMGYLHNVPQKLLTPERLLAGPPQIDTPLHLATRCGFLKQIPGGLLTADLLLTPNHEGLSALFIAGVTGHLDQVPPALITQKALLASVGRTTCKSNSSTLHAVATIGEIKKIPRSLLTAEVLLTRNSDGHTPIELACLYQPHKSLRGALPLTTLLDLQKDSRTPPGCLPWVRQEALRLQTLVSAVQQQTHPAF